MEMSVCKPPIVMFIALIVQKFSGLVNLIPEDEYYEAKFQLCVLKSGYSMDMLAYEK